MWKFNIESLIQVFEVLYNGSMSTVLLSNQIGAYFHMTVGICHGGPLSPVLFSTFFKNIMHWTLHNNQTFISNVDLLAGTQQSCKNYQQMDSSNAYGIETITDKSTLMIIDNSKKIDVNRATSQRSKQL